METARNAKRDETYALQDLAPCESPSPVPGRTQEKTSIIPAHAGRGVGGYNHHCLAEEIKWRPPFLPSPLPLPLPAIPSIENLSEKTCHSSSSSHSSHSSHSSQPPPFPFPHRECCSSGSSHFLRLFFFHGMHQCHVHLTSRLTIYGMPPIYTALKHCLLADSGAEKHRLGPCGQFHFDTFIPAHTPLASSSSRSLAPANDARLPWP